MSAQGAQYDYELDYIYTSSAAPEIKEQPKPSEKPHLEAHNNPNAKALVRARNLKDEFLKAVACICACVIMISFTSITKAVRQSASHELEQANNALMKLEQANRILNVELNAVVANIDIDRVATEELGLVKVGSENEHYLVSGGENRVIFDASQQ